MQQLERVQNALEPFLIGTVCGLVFKCNEGPLAVTLIAHRHVIEIGGVALLHFTRPAQHQALQDDGGRVQADIVFLHQPDSRLDLVFIEIEVSPARHAC